MLKIVQIWESDPKSINNQGVAKTEVLIVNLLMVLAPQGKNKNYKHNNKN